MAYNNFNFVCKLGIPQETEKFKPYTKDKYESGWIKETLRVTAKTDESSVLLNFEGGYYEKAFKITTYGNGTKKADGSFVKGEKIEVAWEDRKKKSILDKVSNNAKITFDLSSNGERYYLTNAIKKLKESTANDEEKIEIQNRFESLDVSILEEKLKELESLKTEFISYVDMIAFLKTELPKHKEMRFRVTGNVEYSEYNGKTYRRFIPKKIEKSFETKEVLKGQVDIFFNSSSLDGSIFEDSKKYILNGWTKNYDGQLKKEIYVPTTFIFDASKLDLNKPEHKARVDFLVDDFTVDDDKIYQLQYEVKFMQGAERKSFTEDDLTDYQKRQIASGQIDFDEIKRRAGGFKLGDRIDETRLVKTNSTEYPDGRKETELTLDDFVIIRETKTDAESTVASVDAETEDVDDLL
jgi:hypothetical protein